MKSDMQLVLSAASFAALRHSTQRRKDAAASPYINHPLALATILASEGGITDPIVLAAALLHDTVEDTATTVEEIEAVFGRAIAAIVAEVTDDKSLPKEERKRLQVVKAGLKSDGAKLVKLADKIANLRDIQTDPPAEWDAARRQRYFHWAAEVVAGLRWVSPSLEASFDQLSSEGPSGGLAEGAVVMPHGSSLSRNDPDIELAREEGTDFRSVLIEFREGGLRVSAQDLGPKAQLMSDDGEYEFWVDVPPEALQKLAATLIQKLFQGDLGAVRNFMKLCETEGITHQYWSW